MSLATSSKVNVAETSSMGHVKTATAAPCCTHVSKGGKMVCSCWVHVAEARSCHQGPNAAKNA